MNRKRLKAATLLALACGALVAGRTSTASPTSMCEELAGSALGTSGKVDSAVEVPADGKSTPAFCEVKGTLHPAPGSNIGVVYRLPVNWNGKILGLGGGGWAGNIRLDAAQPGLARGYAVAQTDAGHPGASSADASWVSNPEAVKDFSFRAIHEMTAAAKALVRTHYGRPQSRSYYQGCSTGGRMGMMEAQRFPDDYDGIIAGAPVYTLEVQLSARFRHRTLGDPQVGLTMADLHLVSSAVLAACGNGREPYLVNPKACRWIPEALMCNPGQTGGCLTEQKIGAIQTAYSGIRAPNGTWASLPLQKGSELAWCQFIPDGSAAQRFAASGGGMNYLKPLMFGDRNVDIADLDADRDVAVARSSAFAGIYEANDPDISYFVARGGKMLMWHGWNDPSPSVMSTIEYFQAVQREHPEAAPGLRLFLAPGVEHCGGGSGADRLDTLTSLERWVELGEAPKMVVATRDDGSMTRPICPFPKLPHFTGASETDVNNVEAYRCE